MATDDRMPSDYEEDAPAPSDAQAEVALAAHMYPPDNLHILPVHGWRREGVEPGRYLARNAYAGRSGMPRRVVYFDGTNSRACCFAPGCSTAANMGLRSDPYATRCQAHALDAMLNIHKARCFRCGVGIRAFGPAGRPAISCRTCRLPGEVLRGCPKCSCGLQASYAFPHEVRATHCSACHQPGQVNQARRLRMQREDPTLRTR